MVEIKHVNVSFDEIMAQIQATATILGDNPEDLLLDYVPSLVAKASTGNVVLEVPEDHPHWNEALQEAVRQQIATTFTGADGSQRTLTVIRT